LYVSDSVLDSTATRVTVNRLCHIHVTVLARVFCTCCNVTPCHGPLVVVADDEVVQQRCGGPHLKRTWWTEVSTGTVSELWLQTGADGELLLPIVLSRTGGSKC